MNKKTLKGVIVSNKMNKTVVVAVTRLKLHPKYKRRYKVTTRYKVHNENSDLILGDKVIIQESRPISKDKSWVILKKA